MNGVCTDIKFNNLSAKEKDFYNKDVCLTLEKAIFLNNITKTQNCNIWMAERKKRITSSNAYGLFTYVNNKSPDWKNKIKDYYENNFKGNSSTRHGIKNEPYARMCYEREKNCSVVQSGSLVNPKIPWLLYSPDGIVFNQYIIEIKCPTEGKKMKATEAIQKISWIDKTTNPPTLKKNRSYYCQVQLGMFICNLKKCDFIIFSSYDKSIYVINVPYDEDMVLNNYLPKLQYVYFKYCLKYLSDLEVKNSDNDSRKCDNLERKVLSDITNLIN